MLANADRGYPPLGICYISAILKKFNFNVELIDQAAMGLSLQDIIRWVKKVDPDIIGFSTLTVSGSGINAALTSKEIKNWNPDVYIVFGNRHATVNDYNILNKYPCIDICVRDEGENTFLELIRTIEKKDSLKNIKGITYRSNGKIVRNEKRELINNLDLLPFPDRKSLNFNYKGSYGNLDLGPEKFAMIISSRGCPYQCTFCYGRRRVGFRFRSIKNVMEEILYLDSEGYKSLIFTDDNFTFSKKRIIKLCQLMRKNKIDMNWFCEGRVNQVSNEMLREMRRSNCRLLMFGIESANQRFLDYYKKNITPDQSLLAVRKARNAKIPFIVGSFIVGGPSENLNEIYNTLKFAQKLDLDFPLFNILGITPGTDVWDDMVQRKFLDEKIYWEEGVRVSDIDPNGVPTKVISNLILKMLKQFFANPKYLFKALLRTTRSSYRALKFMNILTTNISNFENFHGVRSFWNPEQV
ncbi:MAG: B12-binding domain-containing radical SAM protein [Candidatus Heimdallarchaeota archaeon]